MVMMAMVLGANAQRIASMDMVSGQHMLFLENGVAVNTRDLPGGVQYHVGMTIEQCIMRSQQEAYAANARRYQMPIGAGYGAGMMYGGYPMYGATGTTFSVGNEHWGFSTSSSNYGGYKTSSTGLRVGSFQIATSSAGYSQPTASTRGTTTVSPEQKKADVKAATARYSNMRSSGVVNSGSVQKTTTTSTTSSNNTTVVREISLRSLLK